MRLSQIWVTALLCGGALGGEGVHLVNCDAANNPSSGVWYYADDSKAVMDISPTDICSMTRGSYFLWETRGDCRFNNGAVFSFDINPGAWAIAPYRAVGPASNPWRQFTCYKDDLHTVGGPTEDGWSETLACPGFASFRTGSTFSDEEGTHAHCDQFTTTSGKHRVGTGCDGTMALFTQWVDGGSSYSSSKDCNSDCVSVEVYQFHNGGDPLGLQWLISCDDSIGVTGGVRTFFMEHPTEWTTESDTSSTETSSTETSLTETSSTEPSSTESESWATGTEDPSPTGTETSPSVTVRPRPSGPTETVNPTDEEDDDSGGPNAGVIAGAVVGSVAGLALIVGGLLLAYRAGRR
ncbi:hypothetical protein ACJZ2D_009728 [Fusarium nematophilum]